MGYLYNEKPETYWIPVRYHGLSIASAHMLATQPHASRIIHSTLSCLTGDAVSTRYLHEVKNFKVYQIFYVQNLMRLKAGEQYTSKIL